MRTFSKDLNVSSFSQQDFIHKTLLCCVFYFGEKSKAKLCSRGLCVFSQFSQVCLLIFSAYVKNKSKLQIHAGLDYTTSRRMKAACIGGTAVIVGWVFGGNLIP